MGEVNEKRVSACFQQGLCPLHEVTSAAHCGSGQEPAFGVLAREGPLTKKAHVLARNQSVDTALIVHQRQPFNTPFEHDALGLFRCHIRPGGLQLSHGCHKTPNDLVVMGAIPRNISAGQHPCEGRAAGSSFYENAIDLVSTSKDSRFADSGTNRQGSRIFNHGAVTAFDARYRLTLPLDTLASMYDSQSAFQCHRPCHVAAGHAVHVRGDNREFQRQRSGQLGSKRDESSGGRNSLLRPKEKVVKGLADPRGIERRFIHWRQ